MGTGVELSSKLSTQLEYIQVIEERRFASCPQIVKKLRITGFVANLLRREDQQSCL